MRTRATIGLCLSLLSLTLWSLGQQPINAGQANSRLPTGLRIAAILKVSLESSKSKPGDAVRLETIADAHDSRGAVVIPRHSKLYGRVTYVAAWHRKRQPAILSFVVDRAEWKGGSASLDAPVFGVFVMATDSKKGEVVDGVMAATLRHSEFLNIVSTDIMYDFRNAGGVPQVLHDTVMQNVVMQLKVVPDPAVRTAFVKTDGDLELHSEFLVVLLNGMKVVD
jgi:hypothetical protein